MSPEHAQLEADWLAGELKRCSKYAREAYDLKAESPNRQLALANLIGTLDTLESHYAYYESEAPPAGEEAVPNYSGYQRPAHKKERGFWGKLFLGDN